MRTRSHLILFREWFPPNDPIATSIARLCILREDYWLELQGVMKHGTSIHEYSGFPELDENSSEWRSIYFYRNSNRTLAEIKNVVDALFSVKERKEALLKESSQLVDGFKKLQLQMTEAAGLIKQLRNDLGGHVQHAAVQKTLDDMSADSGGFLQRGEFLTNTHYKFTSELMLAMMCPGVSEKDLIPALHNMLSQTAPMMNIIGTIDEVVGCFIEARHLHLP